MLTTSGNYAAAELIEQVLELVPQWMAGWLRFGEYQEKWKRPEKPWRLLYEKSAELNAEGLFAAELKLVVLGAAETPEQPQSCYMEGFFVDYTDRFETSFVENLDL